MEFYKYLPGLVGGHCIGVDPYYLSYKSNKLGFRPKIILAGRKLNNQMSDFIFTNMKLELKKLNKNINNSKVLVLGATFKENCADFRNSKVFDIMKKMKDNKIFFRVVDPYFNKQHLSYKKKFINFQKIKTKFDLILIAVAHDYFKNIGLNRIKKIK